MSCPVSGCTNKEGMCVHKKLMILAVVIVAAVVVAKVLGWY